jgi:threonyl-tRNA synthetase
MQEVTSFLKMLDEVYGIFGLDYTMALSTRPESYLGEHTKHTTAQHPSCTKRCWAACCRCWSLMA